MKNNLPLIIVKNDKNNKEKAILPGIGTLLEYIPKLYSYDAVLKRLTGNDKNWNKFLKLHGTSADKIFDEFNTGNKFAYLDNKNFSELGEILKIIYGQSIDDFSNNSFLAKFSSKNKLEDILPEFSQKFSLILEDDIQFKKAIELNLNELFKPEILAKIKLYEYEIKELNNIIHKIKINNLEEISDENYPELSFLNLMNNQKKNNNLIKAYIKIKNKYPELFNNDQKTAREKIDHIIGNKYSEGVSSIFTKEFLDNNNYITRQKIINALIGLSKYENLFISKNDLDIENIDNNVDNIIDSFQKNQDKIKKKMKKDLSEKVKKNKKNIYELKKNKTKEYKFFIEEELKNILSDKLQILEKYSYSKEELEILKNNLYKEIKKTNKIFKQIANAISGETKNEYYHNIKNII